MPLGHAVDRRDVAMVGLLFAVSAALYALLGVRFDGANVSIGMQFIDTALLADRLSESLWYYHATAPLMNLFAGVGLRLFGEHAGAFFGLCFYVLGFLVALCVYTLTLKLSASRIAAGVTTALLVFSPSFVLYENWMLYDFPAIALLTFAALALYEFMQTRSTKWGIAFFALLAALCLTRSLFHLAWMVVITALLMTIAWPQRRQILIVAALPLLVVTLWYGKNLYYFGTFSTSSWMGLGLSNITTSLVPQARLIPLVQQGRLTPWALISRFDSRGLIFQGQLRAPTGILVLDLPFKVDGRKNYNFRDILAIDRIYTADAFTVMREFPASYVHGIYLANRMFFSPSNLNPYFSEMNREAVHPMERVFNPLLYGVGVQPTVLALEKFPAGTMRVNTSIPLVVAWVLVFGFAYAQIRKVALSGELGNSPRAVAMGFIVVTAVYVYALSTTIELGENYRYRLMIEPLFFVLAATAAVAGVRAIRRRRLATAG